MFVYVIYDVKTLDICKVYTNEDDCIFDYMHHYSLPFHKYNWKAINIDVLFKLYRENI